MSIEQIERIPMAGEELVKKILSGERDFSRIKLEDGFNLSGHESFNNIQKYIKEQDLKSEQDLKTNPFNFSDAQLRYVKAVGLYLPHIIGRRMDLGQADLFGGYFWEGDFEEAIFWRANLRRVYLEGGRARRAVFLKTSAGEADFWGMDLREANVEGLDVWRTCLWEADLRGVLNLEKAANLPNAYFNDTIVTKKEQAIIEYALRLRKLFVVEE